MFIVYMVVLEQVNHATLAEQELGTRERYMYCATDVYW